MSEKSFKFIGKCFGCHQKPERSYFIKGKQMPICVRCFGNVIGIIIALIFSIFVKPWREFFFSDLWRIVFVIPLALPCVIDGVIQLKTTYESSNTKRLITGILLGVAYIIFFIQQIKLLQLIVEKIFF